MSLLKNMMEPCILMDKKRVPDGEGGVFVQWEEAAEIMAAITLDTTMQARIAEQQGVTSVYTITTERTVKLDFHDVIKRVRDGRTFRITSDGGEKMSPDVSTLDISQVKAEKWELTT